MNCAFDKEKLTGYYDGELDAAEKAEVERHIASCSECLRELGELKSAAILVKELPRLHAPRSIAEGVKKEIQASGRVHSFARVRRTLMWAASAAAVLFIGLNLIYFTSKPERDANEVAAKPVSAAPVLGRAAPAEEPAAAGTKDRAESRRQAGQELEQKVRQDEARKNELDRDRKLDAAPLAKGEPEREKAFAGKPAEKKPTAVPERPAPAPVPAAPVERAKPAPPPVTAAPPAPAAAPRPPVKEEPKPAEPPADKALRKELDAPAGVKQKAAEAGPATDPGPMHLTLASTQMTKSRPEMAEALKKMGFTLLPPPSAAMVKGVARSGAREETAYMFELTDAQIARLRAEFEKPGTSTVVTAKPEDPVMAQFKRGGVFEAKKDVASGGAAAKKVADPKGFDAPKESKDAEEAPAAKVLAEGAAAEKAEKTGEPRRKVVLHFLEVPYIPDRLPAADALKR